MSTDLFGPSGNGVERCWACGRFMRKRVEIEADGSWARTVWQCTNGQCDGLDGDY